MMSSGPQSSLSASSMLVPAVFLVWRKMNLCSCERIIGGGKLLEVIAGLLGAGGPNDGRISAKNGEAERGNARHSDAAWKRLVERLGLTPPQPL